MTGKHRNIWRMMIVMALLCLAMAIHVPASVKSIMLSAGQKKQLSVNNSWKNVKWKSSRPEIVTVSAKGEARARKPGKAVVTAKSGKKVRRFMVTVKESNQISVVINGKSFTAQLESSETAEAFKRLLPMTIQMEELNGNEKYHYMGKDLPSKAERPGTITEGDLMLYGNDCLVLFYETFRSGYSYTRIGHIVDPSGLKEAAGNGRVTISFQ